MISGEAATRILKEVMRGERASESDTPEEKAYRTQVSLEVDEIQEKGGIVEMPKDWV